MRQCCRSMLHNGLTCNGRASRLASAGLYSKHVPIVPVQVESWSALVNFGSWWPDRASYKHINEKAFKM